MAKKKKQAKTQADTTSDEASISADANFVNHLQAVRSIWQAAYRSGYDAGLALGLKEGLAKTKTQLADAEKRGVEKGKILGEKKGIDLEKLSTVKRLEPHMTKMFYDGVNAGHREEHQVWLDASTLR